MYRYRVGLLTTYSTAPTAIGTIVVVTLYEILIYFSTLERYLSGYVFLVAKASGFLSF